MLILLYGAFQKLSTAADGGLSFSYAQVEGLCDFVEVDFFAVVLFSLVFLSAIGVLLSKNLY